MISSEVEFQTAVKRVILFYKQLSEKPEEAKKYIEKINHLNFQIFHYRLEGK